jgi:hypothetical protein
MAVRNFYLKADIDGRKTTLEGGPKNKEGGFDLTIYMRDKGSITTPVTINGRELNGKLYLEIYINGEYHEIVTER